MILAYTGCMAEQLRSRIEVSTERQHHRGERMSRGVKRKPFVDPRRLRPRLEQDVDMRRGGQVEHRILRRLVAPFGHPTQRFGRKRQIDRFLCLLHHDLQPILPVIYIDIPPFQTYYIAYP